MAQKGAKYIFVTGGVLSGLGKGITAASIGKILKSRGYSVNLQKCDPYLNTDAGTLNPSEHGEVFVTADGAETDLDLGHYERFLNQELTTKSSLMSGKLLARVIADERAGNYLGKTVQIIPHVTGAIQEEIMAAATGFDIHIVEIGGTVGDYESLAFIEAIRELRQRVGSENVLFMHVVFLPYLGASKEVKTKPAQNAVRDLRALGVNPDVLIARCDHEINDGVRDKLSMYCDVAPEGILLLPTVDSVYRVPLLMEDAKLADFVSSKLGLRPKKARLTSWRKLVDTATNPDLPLVRIGVVAKYMAHEDTYTSVFEAIKAAAWRHKLRAEINWIDAEELEKRKDMQKLEEMDGIIVPGGFGARGTEGKIKAINYCIEHKIPYLGLCLGLQMAVVAVARKALNDKTANSTELDPKTKHPVIDIMESQKQISAKGGTMRLGNYECVFSRSCGVDKLYGARRVEERHRHRYEVNNAYRDQLEKAGICFAGLSPDGQLVEVITLKDHPFFIATQYHPEFKSRPDQPHPLFTAFMKAAKKNLQSR